MFVFKKYDRQNHVWSFMTKYLRFLCKFTSWNAETPTGNLINKKITISSVGTIRQDGDTFVNFRIRLNETYQNNSDIYIFFLRHLIQQRGNDNLHVIHYVFEWIEMICKWYKKNDLSIWKKNIQELMVLFLIKFIISKLEYSHVTEFSLELSKNCIQHGSLEAKITRFVNIILSIM